MLSHATNAEGMKMNNRINLQPPYTVRELLADVVSSLTIAVSLTALVVFVWVIMLLNGVFM
jgi:hypothetical protein